MLVLISQFRQLCHADFTSAYFKWAGGIYGAALCWGTRLFLDMWGLILSNCWPTLHLLFCYQTKSKVCDKMQPRRCCWTKLTESFGTFGILLQWKNVANDVIMTWTCICMTQDCNATNIKVRVKWCESVLRQRYPPHTHTICWIVCVISALDWYDLCHLSYISLGEHNQVVLLKIKSVASLRPEICPHPIGNIYSSVLNNTTHTHARAQTFIPIQRELQEAIFW